MLKKFLLTDKNIDRHSKIWNAIGGGLNAVQSAIILVFISHILGQTIAGIFTFAYAVGTLFMSIGKYGIRNFQVTDVQEKYTFSDYLWNRIVILIVDFVAAVIYLAVSQGVHPKNIDKVIIIFLVILLRMIDAIEDVYIGRYQQLGRLDIGAKILSIRQIITTSLLCILILIKLNIIVAIIISIIVSLAIDFVLVYETRLTVDISAGRIAVRHISKMLLECLPLCVATTLAIYLGNIPKYILNHYMDDATQAIFGYLMMPVFCIMLLSTFIYMPIVKHLGDLWYEKKVLDFKKNIIKQLIIIIGITVAVVIIGMIVGIPVLSIFYNTDLGAFRMDFIILLIGGGFYAMAYFLHVPITIIRWQKFFAFGYIIVTILALIVGHQLIANYRIRGASLLYMSINILLFIIFFVLLVVGISKKENRD